MHEERAAIRKQFENAKGEIRYGFTNNYMFIHLLEENLDILKSLICALLHLKDDDSVTVRVLNPIQMSDQIEGKTYIMDIEVLLNNELFVNLEMQVCDLKNYDVRSLQYLCRAFDNLMAGDDYIETRKAIHIGFVDYDHIKKDSEEFYSEYRLKNKKTGTDYTDGFSLRIVRMKRIDRATAEDKEWGIDKWVRLFKAKTWEEIKMIAEKNETQMDAAAVLYGANLDDVKRRHAQAYEDFVRWQKWGEQEKQGLITALDEAKEELNNTKDELSDTKEELNDTKEELNDVKEELEARDKELKKALERIAELEGQV